LFCLFLADAVHGTDVTTQQGGILFKGETAAWWRWVQRALL